VSGVESQRLQYPRVLAWIFPVVALLLAPCWLTCSEAKAASGPVIYRTGFETSEGYTTNQDLAGQNGWVSYGSGGNGIVTDFFPQGGQQAYVGFSPPNAGDDSLFLYQPINKKLSRAQFSLTMGIADSTTTNYDDFYWGFYNQDVHPLFTLDFDNAELRVYYWLDDTNSRTWSGLTFSNAGAYRLTMDIDFSRNRWSATFNGMLLATNQPITTVGAALNLGDIDAGWGIYDTSAPGDNFMLFDDYTISGVVPSPELSVVGKVAGGTALRLFGQDATTFAIDASTNLSTWTALKTNVTTGGSFDYIDGGAGALNTRFYRARWVP
jgi:hypothetical protein